MGSNIRAWPDYRRNGGSFKSRPGYEASERSGAFLFPIMETIRSTNEQFQILTNPPFLEQQILSTNVLLHRLFAPTSRKV